MSEYRFLTSAERGALQLWHGCLGDNRGDRARLRRAESAEDILLTDAFFHFLHRMPESWREKKPMLTSAAVAGLLSHVRSDKQVSSKGYQPRDPDKPKRIASFAELLATPMDGKGKPPLSELRFQQLQKSRTPDEFYLRVLRAVRLLNGNVNVPSLANDIIHWHQEFNRNIDREPAKRLAVQWATDYFTNLPKETN